MSQQTMGDVSPEDYALGLLRRHALNPSDPPNHHKIAELSDLPVETVRALAEALDEKHADPVLVATAKLKAAPRPRARADTVVSRARPGGGDLTTAAVELLELLHDLEDDESVRAGLRKGRAALEWLVKRDG